MTWSVYIIQASDNSYYTGSSNDVQRRFEQHKEGKGAKYFYGRDPIKIVYKEDGHSRSSANKRESEIKKLSRSEKELLINSTS